MVTTSGDSEMNSIRSGHDDGRGTWTFSTGLSGGAVFNARHPSDTPSRVRPANGGQPRQQARVAGANHGQAAKEP
jgi:hypothetical protein